jgi:hypothetical protein
VIISNVIGGLGNQMFQYAFGRAQALRYGVPLKLDLHEFRTYKLHSGFLLDKVFTLPAQPASAADRRQVLGWRGHLPMLKMLRRARFAAWRGPRLLVQDLSEPTASYVRAASADCYLLGYWQSENYFAEAAEQVRRDFRFVPELSADNRTWARRILDAMAVSLHIRRGDYASDPQTRATHGLSPPEYYRRAAAYIAERAPGAQFFVFSDDLAWARESLKLPQPHHFVDCNGPATSFHDMRLISLCRHHVIANSSFSWWGAWLCEHAGKMVVAPARWLAEVLLPDVAPVSWVRL